MKMFKTLLTVVFALSMLHARAQKNLVENGGFEDDTYGWNAGAAKLTPWDVKTGKSSCAIISADASAWLGIDQLVSIPKKAGKLEFSAWLKTINVVKGKDEWNGAVFSVEFLDKADKKAGEGLNIITLTGDHSWELASKEVLIPAGAVRFKLLLAMANATGTFLIDDVAVKVIMNDGVTKN
ncbi:hypothetical protein SNE26_16410 [Mucilaginibacter sp. cycad4]|uniref:hypothetical protein n=1 Tax=Mucilaginibacter sp. cycad4 TaxID=3342096 RepID=UPI002AABF168|nr:hypothetical protein [Mucilaginibacter gossypii]WPU97610.1 hypothetical protein SNE26_16410 [Mucilaginibacter gossypii]